MERENTHHLLATKTFFFWAHKLTCVSVLSDFLYKKIIFTTPFFNLPICYKSPRKNHD
jgi:hypothetical protein